MGWDHMTNDIQGEQRGGGGGAENQSSINSQ